MALGAPELWAKHDNVLNMPVQFLPVILLRTGNLSLDISIDFGTPLSPEGYSETSVFLALLDKHHALDRATKWLCRPACQRITRLYAETLEDTSLTLIEQHAGPYLGSLRKLYLDAANDVPIELPSKLAGLSAVTELDLVDVYTSWSAPIFSPHLTYLAIRIHSETDLSPSHSEFQDFLNSMPSLRTLVLVNIIPSGPSEEIVAPPSLRLFSFDSGDNSIDTAIQTLRFLAGLQLPATCTRFVHVIGENLSDVSDSRTGATLIKSCVQACIMFGSHTGHEVLMNNHSLSVVADEQPITLSTKTKTTWTRRLRLDQGGPGQPDYYLGPLTSGFDLFGLDLSDYIGDLNCQDLRAVTFLGGMGMLGRWAEFAKSAPQVRRIGVRFKHCLHFLHSLADKTDDQFKLFPLLQVIVLHDTQSSQEDLATTQLSALTDVVRLRSRSGTTPLREVVVSEEVEGWGIWAALSAELKVTFM